MSTKKQNMSFNVWPFLSQRVAYKDFICFLLQLLLAKIQRSLWWAQIIRAICRVDGFFHVVLCREIVNGSIATTTTIIIITVVTVATTHRTIMAVVMAPIIPIKIPTDAIRMGKSSILLQLRIVHRQTVSCKKNSI